MGARFARVADRVAALRRALRMPMKLIGALGLAWLLAPAAAFAQPQSTLPDRLCSLRPLVQAYPTEDRLRAVAAEAEQSLARLRARGEESAADRITLDVPAESAAPPSDAALAEYCAAAGEAMRLGAHGSQAQAVIYLLVAFRHASNDPRDPVAIRSAYRLGLVGVSSSGATGTRGARAAATADADDIVTAGAASAEADAPPGEYACVELRDVRLATISIHDLSMLALECAAGRAVRSGDGRTLALSALRLSRVERSVADEPGRDSEALRQSANDRLAQALAPTLALTQGEERAILVTRLVEALLEPGVRPGAALIDAARALRRTASPETEVIVSALEARLALAQGDRTRARAGFASAILAESRRSVPARLPTYYLMLAQADPEHRAAHLDAAYATLENLRPLLPRFDPLTEETSFALYMRDVFLAAVEEELGGVSSASEQLRIRHAQEIAEAYRQAELQSAFGSECLPSRGAARPEDLRPGETLLYPLLLPNRVELLFVAGGDGAGGAPVYRRLPPIPTGRGEVARLVDQMVLAMSGSGNGDWRAASRRLYDILIAPVADRLVPGSTLAIVPDGPLRALPFAALIAPDGRFLIERTALSLLPALAYAQPAGDRRENDLRIVAASLQRQMTLPVGFFSELAGTAEEARVAASFARDGRLLPDFTRAELQSALAGRRIDVLHLATHASFNGRSDRAFIVANGEVVRLSELREMIDRSRVRGEPLDLIVLSACETAVGDEESTMGLAGAAVQAGARSVVGSLWQVNDAGTAELMRQFYRRYSEGGGRAEALRGAQLALLSAGGDNADPNVWAAFAWLGAWR